MLLIKSITGYLVCLLFSSMLFAQETITLIAEDDWYPYSAERNGKPEGMAVDIARAAYQAVGVELTLISKPYARCMYEVKQGMYAGCFDTSKDAATEAEYLYPQEPLFYATFGIYTRADYPGQASINTLEGKRVGFTNGYSYGLLESNEKIIRDDAPSDESNFHKLLFNRFDFTIVYTRVADVLMKERSQDFEGKIKLAGTTETIPLYISFSKTHPDGKRASELFDQGMKIIRQNGRYQEIEKEWDQKYPHSML